MSETFAPERVPSDPAHFAIGGVLPGRLARPTSREEVAEVLKEAARDELTVVPWGGGMALPRERGLPKYDVALDLSGVDRIVEYEPDDLTVTVECGVTLERLRNRLAEHGHELPLEAPNPHRATIGGVLAANASGPRRYRFGSPRDRILGARFALGDGTLARTGGKVVKNVAGYAVHRLACGSRGGLLAILEASFKLTPAPQARRTMMCEVEDAAAFGDRSRWEFLTRLEPAMVTVTTSSVEGQTPYHVMIGLEDDQAFVNQQAARITERLGVPDVPIPVNQGFWQAMTNLQALEPSLTFATADNTPAALAPVIAAGARQFVFHAPAGRLHVSEFGGDANAFVARLAAGGFALIDASGHDLAPPAAQPAVRAMRARIREALDPGHRFALGERWVTGF